MPKRLDNRLMWALAIIAISWPTALSAQTSAPEAAAGEGLIEWPPTVEQFLSWNVFDIAMWRIIACLLVFIVGLAMKNGLMDRLLRPAESLLDRTETELDNALLEAVRKPGSWLFFTFSVWLGLEIVQLPDRLDALVTLVLQTIGTVIVAWTCFRAIDVVGMALTRFVEGTDTDIDDHMVPLVKRVLRVVLVVVAGIAVVQQWGYDVTSLIAGLGIGGIAFALAAQDTLSNWFGSLMIFTDQPFRLGDWVKSGGVEGVVEEVGLRSTKVRTFDKSLYTIPNKKMANDSIENFSMREQRRINLTLGLSYSTTRAQMQDVLQGVRKCLEEHPLADPASVVVFFTGFGDSTLDVIAQVFLKTNAFGDFAPAREEVLLQVMGIIEDAGTSLAFPSQSIYVETPIETRQAA